MLSALHLIRHVTSDYIALGTFYKKYAVSIALADLLYLHRILPQKLQYSNLMLSKECGFSLNYTGVSIYFILVFHFHNDII